MDSIERPLLLIEQLRVAYRGNTAPIIDGASLSLDHGEIGCVVGSSGCGKTTLLRAIAGFIGVEDGTIEIAGAVVSGPHFTAATEKRGIGLVFQDYALFPHLRVVDNITFGLRHLGPAERAARVQEMIELVGLGAHARCYPHELSGGQQQRVALARALAHRPQVLHLDEPLSNLDPTLREKTRRELRGAIQRAGITTLFVTHEQEEAFDIGDRVAVLHRGQIEQVGTPLEIYRSPANTFVAGFIGAPKMNLLKTQVVTASPGRVVVSLPGGSAEIAANGSALAAGAQVTLGVRPEHLHPTAGEGAFQGRVTALERLGRETLLYVTAADGSPLIATDAGDSPIRIGDTVKLAMDPDSGRLFGSDGAALSPTVGTA